MSIDRGYDMIIPNIKECTECQRKTEKECEECRTCNWCIIEDKYGDQMGSCVVTERYTEAECKNYDEKDIVRKKILGCEKRDELDLYFLLILISLNYLLLTPNIIRCRSTTSIQLSYYITTALLLHSLYNVHHHMTYKTVKENRDPYTPKEQKNMQDQKRMILSISSIASMTVCIILCMIMRKCLMPFAISFGLLLGFGIGTLFIEDVEPNEKNNKMDSIKFLAFVLTLLLLLLFTTRIVILRNHVKPGLRSSHLAPSLYENL